MRTLRMVRMRRMTTMVLKEWFTMCGSLDDLPSWCALQNWLKHSNTMYHNNDDNDDDDDNDDGPQRMQRNHALRT